MTYHNKYNTTKVSFITLLLLTTFFVSCNAKNQQPQQANNSNGYQDQQKSEMQTGDTSSKLTADIVGPSVKDKSGNLWFGTYKKGLFKYDGNVFTHIAIRDEPKENSIHCLYIDKENNIWIGADDKIWKYDGKVFTHIPLSIGITSDKIVNSKNNQSSLPGVMCFMQDKYGKIWIGAGDGVYVYNGISLTRFLDNKNIINKDSIRLRAVQTIIEDKKGNIWFGSGGDGIGEDGICLFDGKTLTSFKPKGYGRCMASMEDENGDLYFSSGYSIFKYDGKSFVNIAEKEVRKIWSGFIFKDKNGKLWFGAENLNADGGLYVYNKQTFTKFNTIDAYMNSVIEDNNGNLWFGTTGQGLFRYDGKEFKSYSK